MVSSLIYQRVCEEHRFQLAVDNFHPVGIPDSVQLAKEYKKIEDSTKMIIDDFQTNQDLHLSSSGSSVSFDGTTASI